MGIGRGLNDDLLVVIHSLSCESPVVDPDRGGFISEGSQAVFHIRFGDAPSLGFRLVGEPIIRIAVGIEEATLCPR